MSERCKYVSIDGTELVFRDNGKIFLGLSDLRSFEYQIYTKNRSIFSFKKNYQKLRSLPIYITTADVNFRNRVFDIFEKDIIYHNEHPESDKTGRLYIGEYYLAGFVYASNSEGYLAQTKNMRKTLSFVSNASGWIKEEKYSFNIPPSAADPNGIDYPHGFLFDYGISNIGGIFTLDALQKADFKMNIYGPINSPLISIGKNLYGADVTVSEGEYLTIDSREPYRSVILTRADGERKNCFSKRYSNVFEPIETGTNYVMCDAGVRFDITLFIERSEPEWI